MAILIHPDGAKFEVKPDNGKHFTLDELYKHCDCSMVQVIYLEDGRLMYLDEEGKFKEHYRNADATVLLHKAGGMMDDYIAGNALICEESEVR